jgi:hypothetical protein
MNTVSTGRGTPVVDDGPDVGFAQPRGDLVECDQHQIPPSPPLERSQDGAPIEVDGHDCLTLRSG